MCFVFLGSLHAQTPQIDSLQRVFTDKNAPKEVRREAMQKWKKLVSESNARIFEARPQQKALKESTDQLSKCAAQVDSIMENLMFLVGKDTLATLMEKEKAIELLSLTKERIAYKFLLDHIDINIAHSTFDDDFRYRDATCFWYLQKASVDNWNLLPELMSFLEHKRNGDETEFAAVLLFNIFQDKNLLLGFLRAKEAEERSHFALNREAIIKIIYERY